MLFKSCGQTTFFKAARRPLATSVVVMIIENGALEVEEDCVKTRVNLLRLFV
jgi:hypothetical protein